MARSTFGSSGQAALLLSITGDKELDAKIRSLDRDMQRKIGGKAVNAGLTVILKAQRAAAPNKRLKKALGKRNRRSRKNGMQEGKVGLNVGLKGDKQFKQGHLLMLGTEDRYTGSVTKRSRGGTTTKKSTGKKRAFRGRVKPSEWLRSATNAVLSTAAQVALSKAWELIRNAARR